MNSTFLMIASIEFQKVFDAESSYYHLLRQYWYESNFLTLTWWMLLILTIISPIIWWILLDKTKIFEVITYGLFLGTIATILDSIGTKMMLWTYPIRLSPYLDPQFYPYDIALVIIPYMLIYQWITQTKRFIITAILLAAFISYVAEPFFQWTGAYQTLNWKHIYSFTIYPLIAIFTKFIMIYLSKKSVRNHP
ncbi:hypothetical protein IM538_06530 [Cytobacillus suaedae]|nr:hypothetical protein IM538_06530 [Cytobacillus suaedae]